MGFKVELQQRLYMLRAQINEVRELCEIRNQRYVLVRNSSTESIFIELEEIGFFDFHVTNIHQRLVNLSQIVCYIYKGYKAWLNGFKCREGEMEVHHRNHNTLDDSKDNLTYVSPYENKLLSLLSKNKFNVSALIENASRVLKASGSIFNEQGKAVRDSIEHFAREAAITIRATKNKLQELGEFCGKVWLSSWRQICDVCPKNMFNRVMKNFWLPEGSGSWFTWRCGLINNGI